MLLTVMLVILHYGQEEHPLCAEHSLYVMLWGDAEERKDLALTFCERKGDSSERFSENMQKGKKFHMLPLLWKVSWHRICQRLEDLWSFLHPELHYQLSLRIKESCGGIMQASDIPGLGLWTTAPCSLVTGFFLFLGVFFYFFKILFFS